MDGWIEGPISVFVISGSERWWLLRNTLIAIQSQMIKQEEMGKAKRTKNKSSYMCRGLLEEFRFFSLFRRELPEQA